MTAFDPNAAASKESGIFGLRYTPEEGKLVLIPIPWEATTSYGGGTSNGPQAIFNASKQVDLYDFDLGNFYEAGIAMLNESQEILAWNKIARKAALSVIAAQGSPLNSRIRKKLETVNAYSQQVNHVVYTKTKHWLEQGKLVGLVGGDHSTPFGAIQAFLEKHPNMGILHIDAHADLRNAYEGFEYSHASIMHNIISKTTLPTLVQVGIRDFCEEEFDFIQRNPNRITTFFDAALQEKKLSGINWRELCTEIVNHLPHEVYISFDIDGLDPRFCPHTGTPVPGGLEYAELLFLIKQLVLSGRKIIGFDLNEVSPGEATGSENPSDEWDANVGARLLYKLCGWTLKCNLK